MHKVAGQLECPQVGGFLSYLFFLFKENASGWLTKGDGIPFHQKGSYALCRFGSGSLGSWHLSHHGQSKGRGLWESPWKSYFSPSSWKVLHVRPPRGLLEVGSASWGPLFC